MTVGVLLAQNMIDLIKNYLQNIRNMKGLEIVPFDWS